MFSEIDLHNGDNYNPPDALAQMPVVWDNTGQEDKEIPAFTFQSILLHQLPDRQGWQIMGVKHDRTRELIATLTAVMTEQEVERLANNLAKNLAGKPYADID